MNGAHPSSKVRNALPPANTQAALQVLERNALREMDFMGGWEMDDEMDDGNGKMKGCQSALS